jgi:hypothetical protein
MRRYIGGLVSTVDLLEYSSDVSSIDPGYLTALRNQAELLVQKLSPG